MKFFILLLFASSVSLAGTEGFIYKGQSYIVYKDGEKVGKTFVEIFSNQKDSRKPNAVKAEGADLFFTQDGNIKCYRSATNYDANISCVRFD